MSRPRTATNVLRLRGAYKNHPERARKKEPTANPLADGPPDHLSDVEKKMWHEIVRIAPHGVLMASDALLIESLSVLWVVYREEKADIQPGLLARLDIQMGRLGLSPSDRAKLQVEPKRNNEFDDL